MSVSAVAGFSAADAGRAGLAVALLLLVAFVLPPLLAWLGMSISREVDALERERDELKRLYGRARHDALVDGLTGLGNHRAFQDELARQLEVSKRRELPLALILIDVDDLKVVNDTHGHAAGDRLLVAVGADRLGAAQERPRVPRWRRRVRDPPAGLGRQHRPRRRPPDPRRGRERRRPERPDRAVLGLDRCLGVSGPSDQPASSTGMPTPRCTGASATAGPRSSRSTPSATGWRPRTDRSASCRTRSARSSRRGRCAPSTSRSSRWRPAG